jgi:hypothetical protein
MPTAREQAYNDMLGTLTGQVGHYTQAKIDAILELLEAARKDVVNAVASTDWDAYHLAEKKKAVEEAIGAWERRSVELLNDAQANLFEAGIDVVDGPLAAAGFDVASVAPVLPASTLEVAQGYSADLIIGVGDDAIKKINGILSRGIMGGASLTEVIGEIGRSLDGKGAFSSIASRAEAIARTEMGRVHQAGRQGRIMQIQDIAPALNPKKKWIHSGKSDARKSHKAAHGEIVALKEKFSNGIIYPHAPGLPAKEVVNCGCTHVLISDDWDNLPTDWSKVPYTDRAIYDPGAIF